MPVLKVQSLKIVVNLNFGGRTQNTQKLAQGNQNCHKVFFNLHKSLRFSKLGQNLISIKFTSSRRELQPFPLIPTDSSVCSYHNCLITYQLFLEAEIIISE